MPLDPAPVNVKPACKFIEFLPEFDVFDGFAVGGTPAFLFPAVNPAGDAVAHIARIQMQDDRYGALNGA